MSTKSITAHHSFDLFAFFALLGRVLRSVHRALNRIVSEFERVLDGEPGYARTGEDDDEEEEDGARLHHSLDRWGFADREFRCTKLRSPWVT